MIILEIDRASPMTSLLDAVTKIVSTNEPLRRCPSLKNQEDADLRKTKNGENCNQANQLPATERHYTLDSTYTRLPKFKYGAVMSGMS